MQAKKINIAIDGYSSCGKSTMAKALAQQIGYTYVDSGAMYRAITLYFIQQDISLLDEAAIEKALTKIALKQTYNNGVTTVYLNDTDVSTEIRNLTVANMVSEVASIKSVRIFAVAQQQAYGVNGGVVMDGRDVGTVIFPNAELKIFMTASEAVRIQRRFQELKATNPQITEEEVKENIRHRDFIDTTRAIDPLIQATDAKILDNTYLNKEEQLDMVLNWYQELTQSQTNK